MALLSEDLKALGYAIHDTIGHRPELEDETKTILKMLNERGWFLVDQKELERYARLEAKYCGWSD